MNKTLEQLALEKYPEIHLHQWKDSDLNRPERKAFIEGAQSFLESAEGVALLREAWNAAARFYRAVINDDEPNKVTFDQWLASRQKGGEE